MIYYSHVNEDSSPEITVVNEFSPEHIVCVTGSGARVLALLACPSLSSLIAVDNNPEAQFLLELSITALKSLEVAEYLRFTGHYESTDADYRMQQYKILKEELSPDCSEYWDRNLLKIRSGIVNIGHFETFLKKLRPLLRIVLGRKFYRHLYGTGERLAGFSLLRWNAVLKTFSYRQAFQILGNKDVAFVSKGADSRKIRDGFKKLTEENLLSDSFISHLVFIGHLRMMKNETLPVTLNEDFLKTVQKRLIKGEIRLEFRTGDIRDLAGELAAEAPGRTFYSLSDVLSFISQKDMEKLIHDITTYKKHPAAIVFRSFLKNSFDKEFQRLDHLEKSRMYHVFKTEV